MKKILTDVSIILVLVFAAIFTVLGLIGYCEKIVKENDQQREIFKKLKEDKDLLEASISKTTGSEKVAGLEVTNYQNGIYYFNCTDSYFGFALSQFLSTNTNLEVSAMAGNVTLRSTGDSRSDYGATSGYFVTFRRKK